MVHGLGTDRKAVEAARKYIQSLGLYGRVSIDCLTNDRLPYVDNLINLLVVEKPSIVANDELLRVLAPNGKAYIRDADG